MEKSGTKEKSMPEGTEERELDFFSKYLSIWVAVCFIPGTALGYAFPGFARALGEIEIAEVSIPVAVVLLIMM